MGKDAHATISPPLSRSPIVANPSFPRISHGARMPLRRRGTGIPAKQLEALIPVRLGKHVVASQCLNRRIPNLSPCNSKAIQCLIQGLKTTQKVCKERQ